MATKAELRAVLTLNNVQFLRSIKSAVASAKAMAAQFARNPFQTTFVAGALAARKAVQLAARGVEMLISVAKVGFVAVGAAGAAAAGVMILLSKAAIDAAGKYEQFQVSFEVLLKSATAASARMKELAEFAQRTPFHLDEVAAASRTLEVLTKGALSTGKGLELVGDVAAGTLRPIDEMANTIGRLYDSIRSGRPAGESLLRLQEIGAISGEGRSKLEAQMAGGRATEAWKTARLELSRFSGMMDKQSHTWVGMMSNFHDAIEGALREFGGPMIEGLKPSLDLATKAIGAWAPQAREFGQLFTDGINDGLKLVFAAFSDPGSLIDPFATGLRAAAKGFGDLLLAGAKSAALVIASPTFFSGLAGAFVGLGEVMKGVVLDSFRAPMLDTIIKSYQKLEALFAIPINMAKGVSFSDAKQGVFEQWKDINSETSSEAIRSGQEKLAKATDKLFQSISTGIAGFKVEDVLGAGADWGKAKDGFRKAISAGAGAMTAFAGAHASSGAGKLFEPYRGKAQHMGPFSGNLLNGFATRMLNPMGGGSLGSTGGLSALARRTTSLIPLSERRAMQNKQVQELAEKGIFGRIPGTTALAHDAVRRGDRRRRQEGERERQRKERGELTDSETLKAIRAQFDKVTAAIIT